uniref:Uncharacterized protein n=2 Tax=Setaria italica TaxID=4555 RepID=K3Y136_SETIT
MSALVFCRSGGTRGLLHSSAQQRREDQSAGDRHNAASAAAVTAVQVEASLNRKNVEVVQGDRSATLLPDEAADALGGVGAEEAADAWVPDQETGVFVPAEEAADAWVPDQETGVFVPAEEAAGNGNGGPHEQPAGPSVLDQAVFVREDMEDVERPPVDMASAHGGA